MKKTIVVILIMLVCASLFAGGNKENTSTLGTVEGSNGTSATSLASADNRGTLERILSAIGNVFNNMTAMISLGLHPFPNIIDRFYDFTNYPNIGVKDSGFNGAKDLLSSDDFYSSEHTVSDSNGITHPGYNFGHGYILTNGSSVEQKERFSITGYLFALLFAAEIIFTAVFGYVMPEQEGSSLFKLIVTKAAKTLLFFVLASALPFLIEAVRYGLFKIANMYQYEGSIQLTTMFDMPGQFMEKVGKLVDLLGFSSDTSPLFNAESGFSGKFLGKLLASVIYIVFEFVISWEIIKTGLHILFNIVEVYLLLAAVMVLLPFSVFTPTKSLTGQCVQSLFQNLIECFIICLIVIVVVPACESASKSLYTYLSSADGVVARVLLEGQTKGTFKNQTTETTLNWHLDFQTQGDAIIAVASVESSSGETYGAYLTIYKDGDEKAFEIATSLASPYKYKGYNEKTISELKDVSPIDTNLIENKNFAMSDYDEKEYCETILDNYLYNFVQDAFYGVSQSSQNLYGTYTYRVYGSSAKIQYYSSEVIDMAPELFQTMFTSQKRTEWRSAIINRLRENKSEIMLIPTATENETTEASNVNFIGQLLCAWVIATVPCYFVKQSSQIAMGLQRGGVGLESFANSMSASMNGMARGMGVATSLLSHAVGGVGGILSHMRQSSMANDQKDMKGSLSSIAENIQKLSNANEPKDDNNGYTSEYQ